jgi:hypothetical protein
MVRVGWVERMSFHWHYAAPTWIVWFFTPYFHNEQHFLDLLLDSKRLCTAAQALAGSPFSTLFRFVEEQAHCHEHGLSAIFVILQNDGNDHFYTAHKEKVNSQQQQALLLAEVEQLQAEKQEQSTLHEAAVAELNPVDKLKAEKEDQVARLRARKRKS